MAHKNRSNWNPYSARKQARKTSQPSPSPAKSEGELNQPRKKEAIKTYSFNEADDRIYDVFRHHGFKDYPHEKRQQLTRFFLLLLENQKVENFTRLLSLRDVAIKHFIDSLMVSRLVKLPASLLDLGTGAGFPGIPLKIDQPDIEIVLAEGVQRRVGFLKEARDQLHLSGLKIIGRNIDETFMYPVQGVITRAVEDARNTLGKVLYCLPVGGKVFLMKGPGVDPEIPMAEKAWGQYFRLKEDIAYTLENTPNQRRLLVYEKTKPAPWRDLDADLDHDLDDGFLNNQDAK